MISLITDKVLRDTDNVDWTFSSTVEKEKRSSISNRYGIEK